MSQLRRPGSNTREPTPLCRDAPGSPRSRGRREWRRINNLPGTSHSGSDKNSGSEEGPHETRLFRTRSNTRRPERRQRGDETLRGQGNVLSTRRSRDTLNYEPKDGVHMLPSPDLTRRAMASSPAPRGLESKARLRAQGESAGGSIWVQDRPSTSTSFRSSTHLERPVSHHGSRDYGEDTASGERLRSILQTNRAARASELKALREKRYRSEHVQQHPEMVRPGSNPAYYSPNLRSYRQNLPPARLEPSHSFDATTLRSRSPKPGSHISQSFDATAQDRRPWSRRYSQQASSPRAVPPSPGYSDTEVESTVSSSPRPTETNTALTVSPSPARSGTEVQSAVSSSANRAETNTAVTAPPSPARSGPEVQSAVSSANRTETNTTLAVPPSPRHADTSTALTVPQSTGHDASYLDSFSGLHGVNQQMLLEDVTRRLGNLKHLTLLGLLEMEEMVVSNFVGLSLDYAVFAVVASITIPEPGAPDPRRIATVGLTDLQYEIDLELYTDGARDALGKLKPGMIIGILRPEIMKVFKHGAPVRFKLKITSGEDIMIVSDALHIGFCERREANGRECGMWFNTRSKNKRCCDRHAKMDYDQAQRRRNEVDAMFRFGEKHLRTPSAPRAAADRLVYPTSASSHIYSHQAGGLGMQASKDHDEIAAQFARVGLSSRRGFMNPRMSTTDSGRPGSACSSSYAKEVVRTGSRLGNYSSTYSTPSTPSLGITNTDTSRPGSVHSFRETDPALSEYRLRPSSRGDGFQSTHNPAPVGLGLLGYQTDVRFDYSNRKRSVFTDYYPTDHHQSQCWGEANRRDPVKTTGSAVGGSRSSGQRLLRERPRLPAIREGCNPNKRFKTDPEAHKVWNPHNANNAFGIRHRNP